MKPSLEEEAAKTQQLLGGKTLSRVWRHRVAELVLEFTDGSRLLVDRTDHGLELSVTGGADSED
jgi:hypothetical protein